MNHIMYDNTPLILEEIIDHCRALIYAIVTIDHLTTKEVLSFILSERLHLLHATFERENATPSSSS